MIVKLAPSGCVMVSALRRLRARRWTFRRVPGSGGGSGTDAGVDELDDLFGIHVHQRDDAFNGPSVEVRGVVFEIGDRAEQARASETAAPPGRRPSCRPALCRGLSMPRLRIAACQRGSALTTRTMTSYSLSRTAGCTPLTSVHDTTRDAVTSTTASNVRLPRAVENHGERLPGDRRAGLERQDIALRRLFQDERREHSRRQETAALPSAPWRRRRFPRRSADREDAAGLAPRRRGSVRRPRAPESAAYTRAA